jgi:hypothetical protein
MLTKSMSLLPLSICPGWLLQPAISGRRIEYPGLSLRTIYHAMHEAEPNDLESMRIRASAIGALALGVVAVGRMVIGRAKIRHFEIDDLL